MTEARTGIVRLSVALVVTAGVLLTPTAGAATAGHGADRTSPRAAEPATKVAEAEVEGAPEPAPVPDPPEQMPGPASGDEMLIELPIVPAGARRDEPDEAHTSVTATSEGTATVTDGAAELESLRVLFSEGGIAIGAAAESELAGLAGYLSTNQAQRVVLHAYAGGTDKGQSDARRLSLSRALAIRSFLVDRGVPAERIFLRPLGGEVEDGPPDRVDILPLRP
ncbi:MAG: OmpA family protein [Kiloniellales bacterium]|nr:OmpA family protein [Kiloniellales bacterium]